MPQLQRPLAQSPHWWQPMAMSAAVPMETASAPRATASHHVGGVAQGARGHEAHRGADALLAQPLVHGGQGQLDGDAHVVADALGRRARAAAEAVDAR